MGQVSVNGLLGLFRLFYKQGPYTVTFARHLLQRNKAQGGAVNTVAHTAGLFWSVGGNIPKVRFAMVASYHGTQGVSAGVGLKF